MGWPKRSDWWEVRSADSVGGGSDATLRPPFYALVNLAARHCCAPACKPWASNGQEVDSHSRPRPPEDRRPLCRQPTRRHIHRDLMSHAALRIDLRASEPTT